MYGSETRPQVNRERGEVALDCRGRWLVLRLDYNAIGALISELGEEFDQKISDCPGKYDLDTLCKAVAIAAARHQPGITTEQVREMEPPFFPALAAVGDCMHAFLHGAAPTPKEEPKAEADAEEAAEARSPLAGLMRSVGLFHWRRASASASPSSGR